MIILSNSLHIIDIERSTIRSIQVDSTNADLREYISDLMQKVARSESKRKFEFASNTTEVKSSIDRMINGGDFSELAGINANRLLRVETQVQEETEHLRYEIQKGALIQVLLEGEGRKQIVFAKADHITYLDETELRNRNGFPVRKKIYKAFLADYDQTGAVRSLYVFDTNLGMAKYWWSGFLELTEVVTDEQNTEKAFDSVDRLVLSPIREEFRADHNILRNRVLGYFRSNREFELDSFLENVIGDYVPVNDNFNVEKFKEKIKALPDKKGFDTQFNIEVEVIKARKLKNIVPINDKIDLHIKDFVDDLDRIIESYKYQGEKYIRIKTDTGYEAFKK